MMAACFDCPEAVTPLRYVCAAPERGGAITVARELLRAEGGNNMASTELLEIEYRVWYIKEALGEPRLSRQRKEELKEEVDALGAGVDAFTRGLSQQVARLEGVARRIESTIGLKPALTVVPGKGGDDV